MDERNKEIRIEEYMLKVRGKVVSVQFQYYPVALRAIDTSDRVCREEKKNK